MSNSDFDLSHLEHGLKILETQNTSASLVNTLNPIFIIRMIYLSERESVKNNIFLVISDVIPFLRNTKMSVFLNWEAGIH